VDCAQAQIAANTTNPWLKDGDSGVAEDASAAALASCEDVEIVTADQTDKELAQWFINLSPLDERRMIDLMGEAQSSEEVLDKLSDVWLLIEVSTPLLMSFFLLLAWLCCCCSACPPQCCQRCPASCHRKWTWCCTRVFRRNLKHPTGTSSLKAVLLVSLVIFFVCFICITVYSVMGANSAKGGFDQAACAASILASTALNGAAPSFVGITSLLDGFWRAENTLANDSALVTGASVILNRTGTIDEAMTVALATLSLLRGAVSDASNTRPKHAQSGQDLFHDCVLCTEIRRQLDLAHAALHESLGAALASARGDLENQLRFEQRLAFQRRLRAASLPLVEAKSSVHTAVAGLTSVHEEELLDAHITVVTSICAGLLVGAFFMLVLNCISWKAFADMATAQLSNNTGRLLMRARRIAVCSWCIGCWFAIAAAFFGGTLLSSARLGSGFCLVLEGLTGQKLLELGPAVNLAASGNMLQYVVDECVVTASGASGGDLLNALHSWENGTKHTLRGSVFDVLRDRMQMLFQKVSDRLPNPSMHLAAAAPHMNKLRATLRDNPVDALMVADGQSLNITYPYQDLVLDSRGSVDGLEIGFRSSMACADFSVGSGLDSLSMQTVPGLQTFAGRLLHFGTSQNSSSWCVAQVDCNALMDPDAMRACTAGNSYLGLKRQLLDFGAFKCNVFQFLNGSACDILGMSPNGNAWHNDCLLPDGKLVVKEVPCQFSEFIAYIRAFDARINLAMDRLDQVAAEQQLQNEIGTNLSRLVREHLTLPLSSTADAAACSVLGIRYSELVEGLCYRGLLGLHMMGWNFLACALVYALLTAIIYVMWRHMLDNIGGNNDVIKRDDSSDLNLGKGTRYPDDSWEEMLYEMEARAGERVAYYKPSQDNFEHHLRPVRLLS